VNLLLLGPQGSGKGTQAARIAAEYGVPHVSTGDMFRAAIRAQTELGRRIQPIYDAGDLVPDDLTVALVEEWLSQNHADRGFALDGFPRTLPQAEFLDSILGASGRELDAVLYFNVPDEVARGRMLGRARAEGRTDDTPESIDRRLEIYHRDTEPVVEHYRTTGKLVPLHAERDVNAVWAEIQEALDTVAARR
jgi:adenylate kinase